MNFDSLKVKTVSANDIKEPKDNILIRKYVMFCMRWFNDKYAGISPEHSVFLIDPITAHVFGSYPETVECIKKSKFALSQMRGEIKPETRNVVFGIPSHLYGARFDVHDEVVSSDNGFTMQYEMPSGTGYFFHVAKGHVGEYTREMLESGIKITDLVRPSKQTKSKEYIYSGLKMFLSKFSSKEEAISEFTRISKEYFGE